MKDRNILLMGGGLLAAYFLFLKPKSQNGSFGDVATALGSGAASLGAGFVATGVNAIKETGSAADTINTKATQLVSQAQSSLTSAIQSITRTGNYAPNVNFSRSSGNTPALVSVGVTPEVYAAINQSNPLTSKLSLSFLNSGAVTGTIFYPKAVPTPNGMSIAPISTNLSSTIPAYTQGNKGNAGTTPSGTHIDNTYHVLVDNKTGKIIRKV